MIAGVDIGGTKIAAGMIDDEGHVRSRFESATSADLGYSKALERTTKMLRDASASAHAEITGIGIGSTGPVDPFSGEIGEVNFFPAWKGENPVKDLERIFHVSVAIENDADAAALGEASWGANRAGSPVLFNDESRDVPEPETIFMVPVAYWSDGSAAPDMAVH